jgi:hypothetical protein
VVVLGRQIFDSEVTDGTRALSISSLS